MLHCDDLNDSNCPLREELLLMSAVINHQTEASLVQNTFNFTHKPLHFLNK